MSYVKKTWITDEIITAEKLNHMEDGIKANDDKSFSVGIGSVTYFECQDVQAVDSGEPFFMIPTTVFPEDLILENNELTITINGTEYQVERQTGEMQGNSYVYYGDSLLNLAAGTYTIPFSYVIVVFEGETHTFFYVTEETTYDITIEGEETVVTPTNEFKTAVMKSCYSTTESHNYFHGEQMETESYENYRYIIQDFPSDLRIDEDVLTIIFDGESYSYEKETCLNPDSHGGVFDGWIYYGDDPLNFLYGDMPASLFLYLYDPNDDNSALFLTLDDGLHDINIRSESRIIPTDDFTRVVNQIIENYLKNSN